MQRQVRALADRVPQRDVERRHRHAGDAAAAVGHGEIPEVLPDRLDGGRVLALHARDDHLLDEGRDRLQAGAEVKQVAHAGDAARGLDIDDENAAVRPERVALDPLRVGPGHAQDRHAHVADGHVGNWARAFPVVDCGRAGEGATIAHPHAPSCPALCRASAVFLLDCHGQGRWLGRDKPAPCTKQR